MSQEKVTIGLALWLAKGNQDSERKRAVITFLEAQKICATLGAMTVRESRPIGDDRILDAVALAKRFCSDVQKILEEAHCYPNPLLQGHVTRELDKKCPNCAQNMRADNDDDGEPIWRCLGWSDEDRKCEYVMGRSYDVE